MTERLYYTDSHLTSFEAVVLSSAGQGERFDVVLDRTAFYPTSGGQPFDTGTLGGARVVDVVDGDDGTIVHVTSAPLLVGATVRGEVDWLRRFDHMQQHTGQHILSAAFDRLSGVRTVSFHLGAETATIDLAREVSPVEIAAAEAHANHVVWEDRPVVVTFATEEEASRLPLRKEPARSGLLRLVDVTACDLSACGGTHVPRTAMIGLIAIAAWERFKGGSRVTFVCGGRALASHRRLRDTVTAATRLLSVSGADVPSTIERMQQDAKETGRALRILQTESAEHRAHGLRAGAPTIGGLRVVLHHQPGWDAAALKTLAQAIVREPGCVVVLAGSGQPSPTVVARSADVSFDAGRFVTRATAELGGRGGGKPELAQGGLAASAERILEWARHTLGEH